jgi:tetratricopeptide (TPR) repeat protein
LSRDDWFRNETWNPEVEAAFNARLGRARNKTQYLRIQAGHLSSGQPDVALALIDRYFELGGDIDIASAHSIRAIAYISMGKIDDAVSAYEDALAREHEFPNLRTRTFIDLPKLIVDSRLAEKYPRALEILENSKTELTFPVDRYIWAGAKALILNELGQTAEAQILAKSALGAASTTDSGFRYHPQIGLVKSTEDPFGTRLTSLAEGRADAAKGSSKKPWWRFLN